jgi:VanZ family protein
MATNIAAERRSRLTSWAPVIAWAAVIFAFSSMPSLGTDLGTWDLILRKAAHVVEYAILGALLFRATRSPLLAVLLAGLYAVSDEVHQTFVEGRVGAPLDVAIDTLGAAVGVFVWTRLADRRRDRPAA